MKKQQHKMYVVRKYIRAKDANSAIKLDKTTPVHDVWIDSDWQKNNLANAIGFHVEEYNENDD